MTISYNQYSYLPKAVESVLRQRDDVDLQYIVVDPGSTDGSLEYLNEKSLREGFQLITDPDDGPADGLNRGFREVSGEYFGYLNADDLFLPGALGKAQRLLEVSGADVVHGDIIIEQAGAKRQRQFLGNEFSLTRYAYGAQVLAQQATFIRTEAIRRVGGFNPDNRTCWDGELIYDLARSGASFEQSRELFGLFRLHDDSISGGGASSSFLADRNRIWADFLGHEPRLVDHGIRQALLVVERAKRLRRRLHGRHQLGL